MRPYLADWLNRTFGTTVFTYIVPNYLMCLAAGAVVGTIYAARRARARGLNPEIFYGLVIWALPAALLGGRVMGFLYAPQSYDHDLLNIFDPLRGDSAAYGGFIGGVAAGVGYMLLRRVPVWRYLDCAGPPLAVAAALTRVGCFLDGCDFGALSNRAWAVTFPAGSDAHLSHLQAGWISPAAAGSLPVHPVQLYLVAANLALAAIVAWRSRRPRRVAGEAFLEFWVLYGVLRFHVEWFRGDALRGFLGALSTSQVISIVVVAAAGMLIAVRRRRSQSQESAGSGPARSGRLALVETLLATAAAAATVKLTLAAGGWGEALAPAVWVYVPLAVLLARRLPLAAHGFSPGAWTRAWRPLLAALAGILAPFVLLVAALRVLRGGEPGLDASQLTAWAATWQLVLVAAPEEIFFRGYAQARLRAWAGTRGWTQSTSAWIAIVLGAALFAAAHSVVEPRWLRAATFFPGLVLGWLRERTGGMIAPVAFHWCANLAALGLGLNGAGAP